MALKHSDYTIAWICALPLEMAAAKTMLDAIHPPPTQPETDHNVYTLGSVSGHNVAIACLPSGVYGTTSAAIVLAHMLPTFLSLRFALMVGIGGGVPSKKDIRLGDVVVSMPAEGFGGVIQYDYGKTLSDGKLHRTGSLNKPPHYLLTAMSKIRCDFISDELTIKTDISKEHLENQKIHKQFLRPAEDQLFMSSYIHRNDNPDCSQCDLSHLMTRPPRESVEPMVHYGLIASGNRVMRDAKTRDAIAKDIDILCFEMEAAGLMDQLPCLVIRGICDYSDSHKNKTWQGYASLTAAAYAKLLLEVLPQTQGYQLMKEEDFTREEEACLQGLFVTDPVEDKSSLNRRKGDRAKGTCEWILETEELRRWLGDLEEDHDERASDILWLHGYPGTGKSTIAMAMADQIPKQYSFANRDKVLAYFFCDSSAEKQRTAISVLRGLLYHLIQQCPWLIKCALPKFLHRKEALFLSFDALWSIFLEIAKSSSSGIYCIIDALDECERDSQEILLGQISQTFPARRKEGVSSRHPRILITSRPYDEIRQSLSNFRCKDLATYSALKNDLALMIHEKVADLTRRKSYPPRVVKEVSQILEQKAEGTFLWVGIACSELAQPQIQARNTIKALQKMPRGLNSMYKQLLSAALAYSDDDDDDDRANILLMLKVVTTARRPLSVRELADMCQLYSDYDESTRFQFTMDDIGRCRLMIIVQDERVQLLHKSVNDFLVKERRAFDVKPSHAELADRCIINLLNESSRGAIFEYAVTYWPEHTKLAADAFTVMKHHELFFEPRSPTWELWAIQYNSQNRWLSRPLDEGFSVLHAAARWDVVPLLTWAFAKGSGLSLAETPYDDQLFQTVTGITPLEEAARSGSVKAFELLDRTAGDKVRIGENVIVAAAASRQNGTEIMTLLLNRRRDQIQVTEGVLRAAAANQEDGKNIMKLLLDRQGNNIQITEEVVKAAAGNQGDGEGIITLLLDQRGDQIEITEDAIARIIEIFNTSIVSLLLDQQGDQIRITEEVVMAATRNWGGGKDIMKLLLDRQGEQIQITEDAIARTIEIFNVSIVALLLDQQGDQIRITEEVVMAAARNQGDGKRIMKLLLDQQGDHIQITEDVVTAAAGNKGDGQGIMALLLDRQGDQIQVTKEVVMAAARNQGDGKRIMKLLLDQQGDHIRITEDVVRAAAGNKGHGQGIMALLLGQQGDHIQITEELVRTAGGNQRGGKRIMTLLLVQQGGQIQIAEDAMLRIIELFDTSIVALLLDRQGDQIQITEDVVKAAAGNWRWGKDIMELLLDQQGEQIRITEGAITRIIELFNVDLVAVLLDRRGDQIQITEDVVSAAAGNWGYGKDIMALLLDQQGDQFHVTEDAITRIIELFNTSIVALLLDRQGDEIQITEDVLSAAARNLRYGKYIMALLLDQQGDQIQITEEVVKAAAGNWGDAKGIMTLLLGRRGDQIQITEEVVKAAAGNWGDAKGIMSLLLGQRGDQIQITEEVVKAAAGNEGDGEGIISLLLNQQGDQIQITEGAITRIIELFNVDLVALLLDRRGDQIQITEEVVKAAAWNWRWGKDIIELLLDQQGEQIQITKGAITRIIELFNADLVALLLDQQGDQIQITEEVVKAAAGNWGDAKGIMTLLLGRRGDQIQITEEVVKAAAGNWGDAKGIMTLLLNQRGDQIQITEEVVKAAAGNWRWGKDIMELLLDQQGEQIQIT